MFLGEILRKKEMILVSASDAFPIIVLFITMLFLGENYLKAKRKNGKKRRAVFSYDNE